MERSNLDYSNLIKQDDSPTVTIQEDKSAIQDVWEDFDYKYMQPLFLREIIPNHRENSKT